MWWAGCSCVLLQAIVNKHLFHKSSLLHASTFAMHCHQSLPQHPTACAFIRHHSVACTHAGGSSACAAEGRARPKPYRNPAQGGRTVARTNAASSSACAAEGRAPRATSTTIVSPSSSTAMPSATAVTSTGNAARPPGRICGCMPELREPQDLWAGCDMQEQRRPGGSWCDRCCG